MWRLLYAIIEKIAKQDIEEEKNKNQSEHEEQPKSEEEKEDRGDK